MRGRFAWLLAAALAFAGCDDRRAGTEVGNPEVKVTAQVAVYDFYDSVEVSSLHLVMMGMDYLILKKDSAIDSGVCWKRPGGILMNLDSDSTVLKDTLVEDSNWSRSEIVLRTPNNPAELPTQADIRAWDNPRYVKFNYIRTSQNDTLPALFEWPQGMEFHLKYGPESVEAWRWTGEIWVPFLFDAYPWAGPLGSKHPTWTYRTDGRGARYILFSPGENAATWSDLKATLPDCFGADSVIIR